MMSTESQTSIGADANSEENLHLDEENDDEQWQSDENDENAEDSDPDSDDVSEYEESITFHNACREFYRNRKDATESFKSSMEREKERGTAVHQRKKTTSIDDAMQRLRREMVSDNNSSDHYHSVNFFFANFCLGKQTCFLQKAKCICLQ